VCTQKWSSIHVSSPQKEKKKSYDRHSLKRPSESVAKFEYLEMTVSHQNNIHKQVGNTAKLGNASYHFHPVVSYLEIYRLLYSKILLIQCLIFGNPDNPAL
jgi:hypothetical protein